MAHGHSHEHRHVHHGHGHDHGHRHAHSGTNYGTAFIVGISLNLVFVAIEAFYGFTTGSVALVADAAHNLSDVLGLAFAFTAFVLARRRPSRTHTYGLRKTTVLAALGNAVLLLVAVGGVAWEAVMRLREPAPVPGEVMMIVAAIGVVINGVAAALFARGRKGDANLRGAFLHLAGDAAVSFGVVVAGAVILRTGWMWVDPVVSLVVSAVILVGTWSLLKQSLNLALDAVPEGIDAAAVETYLNTLPGVLDVHDLHIWAMSTTETALTAHLVMQTNTCEPRFLGDVGRALHDRFKIEHSTLQVEAPEAPDPCRLASEGSV
jgi:cobalt-zinc-cadmium efflux system protein